MKKKNKVFVPAKGIKPSHFVDNFVMSRQSVSRTRNKHQGDKDEIFFNLFLWPILVLMHAIQDCNEAPIDLNGDLK